MSLLKNRRGQALSEALIIGPVLISLISLLGFQVYEISIRQMATHLLDRALICHTSINNKNCERNFTQRLNQLSSQIKLNRYKVEARQRDLYLAEVQIQMPLHRELNISRELKWTREGPPL